MLDTQSLFYAIGIYLLFFVLIFANYGQFASTVLRWSKKPVVDKKNGKLKQPPLTFEEKLPCYVPFLQACIVRKSLYRTSGVFKIIMIISAIGIGGNLFNKFVFAINSYVMFAFNIIMIFSVLLFWVGYGLITADCAKMFGFSWLTIILCFIAPWLFCWYLNNNIADKMRALHKEATFDEHNGNTVIKQRNN